MASEPTDSIPNSDQRRSTDLPWAQVVKGAADSDPPIITTSHADEKSDDATNANANVDNAVTKKPAWNKPSNGVVGGPVMGAESWPALSESTKASPKSLSSNATAVADSSLSKPLPNGSASTSQKHGSSDGIIAVAGPSHSVAVVNPVPSPRPRPAKRGGSGNHGVGGVPVGFGSYNHGPRIPPPPPLPPFPMYQIPPGTYGIIPPPHPMPQLSPDTSPRDMQYRGGFRGPRPVGGFPSQAGNDRRGSHRRGNYGGSRGDGSSHNNHGGRRDQDRGNGNARDIAVINQRGPPRGFIRPPPPNAIPFIAMPPPGSRPFINNMGYTEFQYFSPSHIDAYRGVPVVAPPPSAPAVVMPGPEPVSALLVRQIEYYFSDENLIRDNYLKSNMDDQGWVPVSLIAGFPRVRKLMEDINQNDNVVDNTQFILDSLRPSLTVEVQDNKLRRRDEWVKWVNTSGGLASDTGSKSSDESNNNMLVREYPRQDAVIINNSDSSSGGHVSSLVNGECGQDSAPNMD